MSDIHASQELLVFLSAAIDAIEKAKEGDGKITVLDFPKFIPVVPKAIVALKDASQIKDELKDLSPEEMQQLIGDSFDLMMKVAQVIFGVGSDVPVAE